MTSEYEVGKKKLALLWTWKHNKTTESLLQEAEVSDRRAGTLKEIGLKTIVCVFCSRGKKFDPDVFRNEMQKMGADSIATNKGLEKTLLRPINVGDTPASSDSRGGSDSGSPKRILMLFSKGDFLKSQLT